MAPLPEVRQTLPYKGRKAVVFGRGELRLRTSGLAAGGGRRGARRMSAPFEERSGLVPCATPWGRWYQTIEEVFVEVDVPEGTRARDVQCSLKSRHLSLTVVGKEVLKGKLFDSTIADEATWTLEDNKLIRIVLTKTNRDAGNCWSSLLENEYAADPWVQDQMQRKLTLERFQRENPGFDFSGAEISGNYSKGGPDFSSLGR